MVTAFKQSAEVGSTILTVEGDASKLGWGVSICGDKRRMGGTFSLINPSTSSSNIRELVTYTEMLLQDPDFFRGACILIKTDNTCARHYLNCGLGKMQTMNLHSRALWALAARFGIAMVAEHIRGVRNIVADLVSRLALNASILDKFPDKRLKTQAFANLCKRLGLAPDLDAMVAEDGHNSLV